MFSLYIHIPYCLRKCHYCNFNSITCPTPPEEEYCKALLKELDYYLNQPEWKNRSIYTIYLGGGTPSLLSAEIIGNFFKELSTKSDLSKTEEITIECNPCTITEEKLIAYKLAGINRVSLGAQSFNEKTLKTLGRLHSVQDTINSLELLRKLNFKNISLDLMYGIPNQTLEDLKQDLKDLISLSPDHISAYCLSVENGTRLERMVFNKTLKLLKEEDILNMMGVVSTTLKNSLYEHYEISNFAKNLFRSKHNSAYWNEIDYLGLGAGAHSYNKKYSLYGRRWENISNPKEYIEKAFNNSELSIFKEELTKENKKAEFFMLNLRKKDGFSISKFENVFQEDFFKKYKKTVEELFKKDLITINNDCVALSNKGLFLADSIMESFILI